MRHQPQVVSKFREGVRVAIAYKNFAANKGISHIGLGVAAMVTSKTLRGAGMDAEVWPVATPGQLAARLEAAQADAVRRELHPVSHVVVSAPWVPTEDLQALITRHPDVHFSVVSHSNIGFLMADPNGIRLLREAGQLQVGYHNFTVAGNSRRFCDAWAGSYGVTPAYLPNLYDLSTVKAVGQRVPWTQGHVLRVGVFGATRPLKNMVTAASAVVQLSRQLQNDAEIWLSTGRDEGGGDVKQAIHEIAGRVPGVTVREAGWRSWPEFRDLVGSMHLLLSPSYTESFNMVTADGVAEGVASVVSEAIDWTPQDWVAGADDAAGIARAARRLLTDAHAVNDGQAALRKYVTDGVKAWEEWLA